MNSAWPRKQTTLERPDVDRRYQLWVSPPPGYDPTQTYPLILCLDAPWTFGTATDAARLLGLGKQNPRAIVAGIAHDADGRTMLEQRAMDYTITPAEVPRAIGVRSAPALLGGAEQFRVWLAEVVLPQLRADYAIGDITLVGHSFSALFGAHVLFTDAAMFAGYLLASPSVWWDDKAIFEREAQFAASGAGLAAKVFMSMGAQETDEFSHHQEFYQQVEGRNYDGLQLGWARFENEDHNSVVSAAINRGLRFLLAPG